MHGASKQLGTPGGERALPDLKVRAAAFNQELFPAPALPLQGAPAGETTQVSATAAARLRHALGGGGREAGEHTAAGAAPSSCTSLDALLSPPERPRSRPALGEVHPLCAPVARPSSSLKKTFPVPEQHLQSGFMPATEKVSPLPLQSSAHFLQTSVPPSGFSTGFAVLRKDPTKELVGHHQQHDIALSGLLLVISATTW